jgi:DNA-binding HxlR family transcriptional regulator
VVTLARWSSVPMSDRPSVTADSKLTSKLSRHLRLLRAHGVIQKLAGTHRYRLTKAGRTLITATLAVLDASISKLKQCA